MMPINALCESSLASCPQCGTILPAEWTVGLQCSLFRVLPHPVTFTEDCVNVRAIRCGLDGTVFLTEEGTLYACGRSENRPNKLRGRSK